MSSADNTLLPDGVVEAWLAQFERALTRKDADAFGALFVADSYWRDVVSFTWDIGWAGGADEIRDRMFTAVDEVNPHEFRLATRLHAPQEVERQLRRVLEAFFDFETELGHGTGVLRLVPDADAELGARAWVMLTTLQDLHGDEGVSLGARKPGLGFDRSDTTVSWADRRAAQQAFADRDPEVLIVGGGQAGVMTAARFVQLGVDALVVDRLPRVGDNWRTRYRSLALHNEVDVVDFAYMPFPKAFPQYLPKDKLANWFESYVEAMEVNYWTSTEFLGGDYDEVEERWTVKVRRADGSERVMRPAHVILATGAEGGAAKIPSLPGADKFAGRALHTKQYKDGSEFAGKNVLVVGTATSAHDVAFDLTNHGASVTMLQRSPTIVINIDTGNLLLALYTQGRPVEEIDLVSTANFIYPLFLENLKAATIKTAALDKELIDSLEKVGFRTDQGPDESGYLMKFFRIRGGYYINVGASDLIARGDIKIAQAADIETFVPEGLEFKDGSSLALDAVVYATGYVGPHSEVLGLFGQEVADKVGEVGGYDDAQEIRNMFKPSPQQGLWFIGGGISSCRIYSLFLSLQVKAAIEGKHPAYRGAGQLTTTAAR